WVARRRAVQHDELVRVGIDPVEQCEVAEDRAGDRVIEGQHRHGQHGTGGIVEGEEDDFLDEGELGGGGHGRRARKFQAMAPGAGVGVGSTLSTRVKPESSKTSCTAGVSAANAAWPPAVLSFFAEARNTRRPALLT